ncbi:MAG: glycyl-radical enzyme activating protein [Thermodesulfobacteriota bacterium]|nr:glycyl-radical enzyme activating protein [Thermodesulfobacteriota bacterium]
MDGVIFDIQRYSIHDGPGIRTTVFLKGCPLHCKWCSNPESQHIYPEFFYRKAKCEACGKCVEACPLNVITLGDDGLEIDRQTCDRCMKCVDVCPTHALTLTGEKKSVEEVVAEVVKDEPFYKNSDGGVTISGGEPLFQPEFTLALLKACKEKALQTALDTTGFAKWETLNEILDYVDLALFDIKHLDPEQHKINIGVDNKLILDNLKRAVDKGQRIWVRVPMIPGFNNSEENIRALAEFLSEMPVEKVSFLGYHEWSKSKYEALGLDYPLKGLSPLSEEALLPLRDIIESRGLEVSIGY